MNLRNHLVIFFVKKPMEMEY